MAIEITSNCYSINQIEHKLLRPLVNSGMAVIIKDNSKPFETSRYTSVPGNAFAKEDMADLSERGFKIIVYRQYLVHIRTAPVYLPWEANIRIWKDERKNRAGIKLSIEALEAIAESATAIKKLHDLDLQLGGNGAIPLAKVAEVLSSGILKGAGVKLDKLEIGRVNGRKRRQKR